MKNAPAWKVSPECKGCVAAFCDKDRYSSTYLFPLVFSQKLLERIVPDSRNLRTTPAFSIGALVPRIELFGRVLIDHDLPVGIICLEEMFEQQLSVEEKEFVLAHEYSHIIMNDSPLLLMGNVASSIMNDYIKGIKDKTAKMVLEIAWFYIQTRASLVFGKQSELKADAHAVHVTGNKAAAVAMIERLGAEYAGGLDQPSHFIVRGKHAIPVLTYRDRIDALRSI